MSFWNNTLDHYYQELKSSRQGLTQEQALENLRKNGPNVLNVKKQPLAIQFLLRFSNPLVMILLFASAISAITGETTSFILIIVMVVLSVSLDFYQNYQAEQAAEDLKKSVDVRATVMRSKQKIDVSFPMIVPGDVVLLSAGDLVPADGLILQAKDFFLNQAMLTGESFPVEKVACSENSSTIQNALFMGTSVVSGQGQFLVINTGKKTNLGEISESLSKKGPPTTLDLGLRHFGFLIMRLTVVLVLFVIFINYFFHRPLLESFLFAVALAVGLTPELLPMVLKVTLSRGALRMAKQNVIVKKLSSIENLGSMNILCSDKTGTLTEGKISLERHVDLNGSESDDVLKLAYLNSYFETGLKSPIDEAILNHKEVSVIGWQKIDEVPFDFERRRLSVLAEFENQRYLIVKGATEDILKLSPFYSMNAFKNQDQLIQFNENTAAKAKQLSQKLESEGFRTLGVAWKKVPLDHPHAVVSDETELVFAGLAAFHDPPKEGINEVIRHLEENKVSLKVVTGDGELVARHLFDLMRIPLMGVLSGAEIERLDDAALAASVERYNLFCRVNPTQKNRIILALKSHGHTVGYIGDGVNDAPSLHSADVGFSVESAVDVAKDAADIILLKKDLDVLNYGVQEGRRTHANIMKYIMMGASSNLGNMFSMAGATLFLPFLPMLPIQILLNNFLYDLSEVTIPMDRVDGLSLSSPAKWDIKFIHKFMWTIGLVSSIFDFLTFFIMTHVFKANELLFHTGWFVESIATQVLVIFVIRTRLWPWQSRPHPALLITSLAIVFVAALLPFLPIASFLGFVPLNLKFFAILTAMVASYLLMVELIKQWFYSNKLGP